ncbi:T9SS type A sorting domain-containing protein [Patescibacteria group bacterium]|nr:T9SS type A sorting domain-containing protein [Patescibacteria group bacterium]
MEKTLGLLIAIVVMMASTGLVLGQSPTVTLQSDNFSIEIPADSACISGNLYILNNTGIDLELRLANMGEIANINTFPSGTHYGTIPFNDPTYLSGFSVLIDGQVSSSVVELSSGSCGIELNLMVPDGGGIDFQLLAGVNSSNVAVCSLNVQTDFFFYYEGEPYSPVRCYGPVITVYNNSLGISPTSQVPPTVYSLSQNYPNPFNPTTTIAFDLVKAGIVKLTVYDLLGCQVAELVNGWRTAGTHEVTFDGSNLASGTYIYRLQAGDFNANGKMALIK